MTLTQKKVLRALLDMSIEHGFGSYFSLADIAKKLEITEPLYDNNTNTGLLWEYGRFGKGLIFAQGDWPNATAALAYENAGRIEAVTYIPAEG